MTLNENIIGWFMALGLVVFLFWLFIKMNDAMKDYA
jgi:uncharacterized YccA/Bax inhibitor family protein